MPTLTPMVVALVLASSVVGCTNTRPPERFAVDAEGESIMAEGASPGWFGSAGASDGPPMGACFRINLSDFRAMEWRGSFLSNSKQPHDRRPSLRHLLPHAHSI